MRPVTRQTPVESSSRHAYWPCRGLSRASGSRNDHRACRLARHGAVFLIGMRRDLLGSGQAGLRVPAEGRRGAGHRIVMGLRLSEGARSALGFLIQVVRPMAP